ncbi:MAG: acetate kinase [Pseudomonadota bacterium]
MQQTQTILVINAGSSSIKYQLIDAHSGQIHVVGHIERIGEGEIADHRAGFARMRATLGDLMPDAIGHRVVHGGERFVQAARIDAAVIAGIRAVTPLAPLHNPANLLGIEIMRELFPTVPQVAVFDTAFHHTLPEHAFRYALPEDCYDKHQVRRYGFHGTAHQALVRQAAEFLRRPVSELNLITLHLGNGASVAAIERGRCIDTSMGMTPLEGLVMGSRCGDLDPAIPGYLARSMNLTSDQIDDLLNHHSGLLGLCGSRDMRAILAREAQGDARAHLAVTLFCYRVRKYIGAYLAVLGPLDAVVFSGGIGEHAFEIRRRCCAGLEHLGIEIDDEKNLQRAQPPAAIHASDSRIQILVLPADEEREIARQTVDCLGG